MKQMRKIAPVAAVILLFGLFGCRAAQPQATKAAAEKKNAAPNTHALTVTMPLTDAEEDAAEQNEDGTYRYETNFCSHDAWIVNTAFADLSEETDMKAYVEACIAELAGLRGSAHDIEITESADDTEKFGVPAYRATWLLGANEDTQRLDGLFFRMDGYTFAVVCETDVDWYDDPEIGPFRGIFARILDSLELQ